MAILAADLGGTRIKLGVVKSGRVAARESLPVQKTGLGPQLPMLASAWRSLAADEPIEGISVAFPSIVDRAGRITSDIGKYPDAMTLDLSGWAKEEFGVPLAIENDARMAAIGEWRYGAGSGFDSLVMVTLGTGIGTGVILEGRVLRGTHGQAGCLGGHLVTNYDGRKCFCGAIGCAESEASTSVLHKMAQAESKCGSPDWPLDYENVFAAAERGDECARRLKEKSVLVWSSLAVSLVHAYDPEILILGGGISRAGDWLSDAVQAYVDRYAWTPWGKVRVVRSLLGDDAALVAGEWLVKEKS